MTNRQIVGIAIRLFAIFLWIYTLRYASSLLPYAAPSVENRISFVYLGAFVASPLLVGALLWFFPLSVASKLIPDISSTEDRGSLDASSVILIAFAVMGLWVLTTAIPDIFYWVTYAYYVKNSPMIDPQLSPENIGNIVATIVELVIGFWLLFGSRGLLGIIRSARSAGT